MNVSPYFHGNQVRFTVLAHESVTVGASATPLPNIPTGNLRNEVKRVVLRGDADFTWTGDGSDPAGPDAFPALADEVLVWDGNDLEIFQMASSAAAVVKVIYMA